jgi:hypothetical protein
MMIRGMRVELIKDADGDTIGAVTHSRFGVWVVLDAGCDPLELFADREDAVAHVKYLMYGPAAK